MFQPIAIATATGTVSYLWMTASALPVMRGFRATCRTRRDGWRYALPLAIGVSAIVALMMTALAVITVMSVPQLGVLFTDRVVLATGCGASLTVWCARAAAFGVPRFGHDTEMALALAVVSLKTDDAALLSAVERQYARHVVNVYPDPYGAGVAHTVLGV